MPNNQSHLLDIIITKDGKKFSGIIDYTTTKQLYFFDFTSESEIDYLLLAIMWRGNNNNLRFSVYTTIHYPDVKLPQAKLLPISNIETMNKTIEKVKPPKQRKKTIKFAQR